MESISFNNDRTSYIIGGAFRVFLGASILTMIGAQLAVTIDAMIVGHFISPDALSGVNAVSPIGCIISAFSVLFGTGAGIRISRLMGNRDTAGVKHAFGSAFISLFVVGAVITLILSVFNNDIVSLLCDDERIKPWAAQYLSVFAFTPIFILIGNFLCYCLEVDGTPQLTCKIIIIQSITNIVLDLLFIGVFGMGMEGPALATLISIVVEILLCWLWGLRKSETYGKIMKSILGAKSFGNELSQNMREGAPMTVTNIALAVLVFSLNTIIINTLGTVGMNIWSVCIQVLMMSLMLLNGVSSAAVTIGCMLMGEEDYRGVNLLHKLTFKIVGLAVTALTLIMLILPEYILQLFGADAEMMEAGAADIVRIFSLCMLPFAWVLIRQSFLIVLRYYFLGSIMSLSMIVFIMAGVWILSIVSPTNLWWGFAASLLLLNLIMALVIALMHLNNKNISVVSLIPLKEKTMSYSLSVAYDLKAMSYALNQMRTFLENNIVDSSLTNHIILLTEELATNIVKFGSKSKGKQRFDLHISFVDNHINLLVKDDGKPFNPIFSEHNGYDDHIGLKIVNHLGAELEYKYMYGQNVITAIFKNE